MQEIAERIVKRALALGFDEAVVNVGKNRLNYLKITNSEVDSVVDKYDYSGVIYLTSKKRILNTNIERLDDKTIDARLRQAKAKLRFVKAKKDYNGIAQGPFKYLFKPKHDKRIVNLANDDLADIAQAATNAATESGAKKVAGVLYTRDMDMALATSNGVSTETSVSVFRLSCRAFGDVVSFQDFIISNTMTGVNAAKFGAETARMCDVRRTGKIENGAYDVIFTQSPAGSLLSDVNEMACISSVESGGFLSDKLGKTVANSNVNMYDSGDKRDGVNAFPFDAEGTPTQTTPVIERGVLKNYLHNHSTAVKYKAKSTGNAGLIDPDPNIMVFEHKKLVKNRDALVSRVKRGLLVSNIWYTRYSNRLTGDFSTMPRDLTLYIEEGEPLYAVRQKDVSAIVGIRISENILRMLKNIECAAKDTKQSTSWDSQGDYYFSPSILVRGVGITATQ